MDEHALGPAHSSSRMSNAVQLFCPPLLVFAAALLITAIAANQLERQSLTLAQEMFQFQHNAVINSVKSYQAQTPGNAGFNTMLSNEIPDSLYVRIDTLSRHSKRPVLEVSNAPEPTPERALRSEVSGPGYQWMVTSIPDQGLFEKPVRRTTLTVWVAGITVGLIAAAACLILTFLNQRQRSLAAQLELQSSAKSNQLDSLQVEKNILRQALNESEQRSRDLVLLSGATICELDEQELFGYVSPGMAELLRRAPADLSGVPVRSLVAEEFRENFQRALAAAREEHHMARIDLDLLDAAGMPVAVTLRVLALHDTLHGLVGYRLSLQHRIS